MSFRCTKALCIDHSLATPRLEGSVACGVVDPGAGNLGLEQHGDGFARLGNDNLGR